MTTSLDTVPVPDTLYRVGWGPHVWEWRDWSSAEPDRTFRHRWDDPEGEYRVLYASESRLGAYLESLAQFRPDLDAMAKMDGIDEDDPDAPLTNPAGDLPPDWRSGHTIGKGVTADVDLPLVAVGTSESLSTIRKAVARAAAALGIKDINGEVIRRGSRELTQLVSRFIFDRAVRGKPLYSGIYYLSAYGDDVKNCALFERPPDSRPVMHLERSGIELDDDDFLCACQMHSIRPS